MSAEVYRTNDDLASEIANKAAQFADLSNGLVALSDGLGAMPASYADHLTACEALAADHPERIKWDELKAEFLAMRVAVDRKKDA